MTTWLLRRGLRYARAHAYGTWRCIYKFPLLMPYERSGMTKAAILGALVGRPTEGAAADKYFLGAAQQSASARSLDGDAAICYFAGRHIAELTRDYAQAF